MTFNKIKQTYLIGGVALILLGMLSWVFLLSPRMSSASEIDETRVAVETANAKSALEIKKLTVLKDGLVNERKTAAALALKFPPTADEPTLFRQILLAAKQAKIPESGITSLGPAAPIMGAPSSGAKLPGAGASAAKGAAGAKSTGDLAIMAIAFNAQGTFAELVDLLTYMEDLPRSFLITSVNLSTADKGKFTIAVQGNMYVHRTIPDPTAAPAPAAPPTPAPVPTDGTIVTSPGLAPVTPPPNPAAPPTPGA